MKFTHSFVFYHPCGKCMSGFMADAADWQMDGDDAEWFADAIRAGRKVSYVSAAEVRTTAFCTCPTDTASARQGE